MEGAGDGSRRLYAVMLPFLGQGHLNAYLQLSKMLATRGVAVIYVSLASKLEILRSVVQGQAGWNDDDLPFYFHDLSIREEEATLQPGSHNTNNISQDTMPKIFDLVDKMRDPWKALMKELTGAEYYESRGLPVPDRLVLVFDFFMGWSAAVATKFGVRAFTFEPMSAHFLVCHEVIYEGREEPLLLPTVAEAILTFPTADLVGLQARRHMEFRRLADGILLNTFRELEPKIIRYLESVGVGDGKPIWAVGPIIDLSRGAQIRRPRDAEIMKWLDRQAPRSVLYVSFGTLACISPAQVTELALGLEASRDPFLWVLRVPEDSSLAELLPEGYERRTQGRCLIETGWAPQGAILTHEAMGGFLSHCGWNSCLESVLASVPIIALPHQSDQPANAMYFAREVKVAVEMKMVDGVAKRDEVERAVRSLMGEEGLEMKHRMKMVNQAAVSAVSNNVGSAWKNLDLFIQYASSY